MRAASGADRSSKDRRDAACAIARVAISTPVLAFGVSLVCANLDVSRNEASRARLVAANYATSRPAPPIVIAFEASPDYYGSASELVRRSPSRPARPFVSEPVAVAAAGLAAPAPIEALAPKGSRLLREVHVGADLRLLSQGMTYQLADIAPFEPDAMCRRIDGVSEPCRQRAATRLELIMRGRPVECRVVSPAGAGPVLARCAAGKIDLASDLLRNGLARHLS